MSFAYILQKYFCAQYQCQVFMQINIIPQLCSSKCKLIKGLGTPFLNPQNTIDPMQKVETKMVKFDIGTELALLVLMQTIPT